MSIFTDLLHGRITFSQAAAEAASWASKVVASDPTLTAAAGATLSAVKQGVSNAVMLADTELGQHMGDAVTGIETALDAMLVKATGGVALPFVPLVNATVDQMAAVAKQAIDAWALEAKAGLAAPVTLGAQLNPPSPPVVQQTPSPH